MLVSCPEFRLWMASVFVLISISLCAQERALSKDQMNADFDYLVERVATTNPYLLVKERLYSYSILDSLAVLRTHVEQCASRTDFLELVHQAMNICTDGHCALITPLPQQEVRLYIPLYYEDGSYYVKYDFEYDGRQFQAGSKLVAINAEGDIDAEVARQIPYRYLMRWDIRHRKFYHETFYYSSHYLGQGRIELEFKYGDQTTAATFDFGKTISCIFPEVVDPKRVEYFPESRILYIRVPNMDWNDRKYFQKEIPRIAADHEIDKIVIDVRGNMGGSSIIGRNIFRALLPRPIEINTKIYGNEQGELSAKYRRSHDLKAPLPVRTLLDSLPMNSYLDQKETIKPFKTSIHFEGPIFIVGNEHIYSAAGAVFTFANISENDQIFSVGTPTGWFLGEFTDPIIYRLPHSRAEFKISPTMALTHVHGWDSVMLDTYDFEVHPTVEDYRNYQHQSGIKYDSDYLHRLDPYFKVILNY